MFDIGGGSGGHFVGLHPDRARGLATQMTTRGSEGVCSAGRIAGLLAQAGAEAAGCETPATLQRMDAWLSRNAEDVRWRIELVAAGGGGGGMRFAFLEFPSAAAARAAGRRYADEILAAQERYGDADTDAEREAAEEAYLALLRGIGAYAHDPGWAGGLLDRMGHEGVGTATFIAPFAPEGDVAELRRQLGPLFTALATAMRHDTVDPSLRQQILRWNDHDLAMVVALAPAETTFLNTVARRVLVLSQTDDDRSNDPRPFQYELIYGALEDNAEASYRLLTSTGRYGEPVMSYLFPWDLVASPEATRALGRVLEAGLVEYPATQGAVEWNRATRATEAVIHLASRYGNVLDEADPQLASSLVSLLRPHMDAVAAIGARAGGMTVPGGFDVQLPGGRRALDVDVATLREYLGAAMQHDAGVQHMQLLLAAYTQSPDAQANRIPMLTPHDTRELVPFFADSVRIAGLVGLVGAGLDEAGKDEETTTRLLVGAMNFAAGKGASRLLSGTNPVVWLGRQGVKHLAGEGIAEVEQWLQSREPIEGEEAVDSFLESYVDTTVASLREHIATDPQLSQLSDAEQSDLLAAVAHQVENSVSGPLRVSYADLVAETAKE